MRTFFDTRLEELGPNGFVYTECKCGRNDLLTRGMLKQMGVKPDERLVALAKRLRCQRCGEHGRNDICPSGAVTGAA
jgi:hypothetical protein